ncbi:MAG: hypothetical protein QXS20_06790 [Candidatus Thorarchaeota archaeon]
MSMTIWWKRGNRPGLVLIFLGLAGLAQIPIIWHAERYVQVLSAELQILVSLAAMLVLGGAYVLTAEAMYRWASLASKRKVRRHQRAQLRWVSTLSEFVRSREELPGFAGVALMTGLFLMFYFIPFGIGAGGTLPQLLSILAFMDPVYLYPLAHCGSATLTAVVASYFNDKFK